MMGWDFSSTLEIKMSDSVAAAAAISQTESEKRKEKSLGLRQPRLPKFDRKEI